MTSLHIWYHDVLFYDVIHAFFLRINIFQPSLKRILNFSRFQPRNILRWFLNIEMTKDLLLPQIQYGRQYSWGPNWRCRRLRTGPKYWIKSYFKFKWNIHNWLGAGSEPWVILRLFLIFQDLSLMILIKIILIKKRRVSSTFLTTWESSSSFLSILLWFSTFKAVPVSSISLSDGLDLGFSVSGVLQFLRFLSRLGCLWATGPRTTLCPLPSEPWLRGLSSPLRPTAMHELDASTNKHDTVAGGSVRTDCFSGNK